MFPHADFMSRLQTDNGLIEGGKHLVRHLSDLTDVFCDGAAFATALQVDNPIVYTVSSLDRTAGEGELHCGLGMILPGRIGNEYFLTRGHLHAWRPAAEYYIGLSGTGIMLLEGADGSDARWCELLPHTVVHVPGNTAHRTINTGDTPLTYLGVYSAEAGHDYTSIAGRNFRQVVVWTPDGPKVIDRKECR
jgi:glucose-6-phosphate isomerase, archaeal